MEYHLVDQNEKEYSNSTVYTSSLTSIVRRTMHPNCQQEELCCTKRRERPTLPPPDSPSSTTAPMRQWRRILPGKTVRSFSPSKYTKEKFESLPEMPMSSC